jgi:hypothetical protein
VCSAAAIKKAPPRICEDFTRGDEASETQGCFRIVPVKVWMAFLNRFAERCVDRRFAGAGSDP